MTNEEKQARLEELGMSEETIDTILCLYGDNNDSYNNMLFYLTGYQFFDQLDDDED